MLQVLVFELQVHSFHIQIIDPFLSSLVTHGFRYEDVNHVKMLLNVASYRYLNTLSWNFEQLFYLFTII